VKLSDAEWRLMTVLWQRHPLSAREVLEALPRGPDRAYTTVKTQLTRLVAKGALKESSGGAASLYAPRVGAAQARRSALRGFVDRAFGGYAPLLQFLVDEDELSEADRDELRRLLAEPGASRRRKGGAR
jgi:predicted transcriptional regulator